MRRWLWIGLLAGCLGAAWLPSPEVHAQDVAADVGGEDAEAAPPPRRDKWDDAHSIPRADDAAIDWPKLLVIWLLFLIWAKSADWVNRDSQIFDQGYGFWNPLLFFPFLAVVLTIYQARHQY